VCFDGLGDAYRDLGSLAFFMVGCIYMCFLVKRLLARSFCSQSRVPKLESTF
jgi:hypothetical protein